MKSNLTKKIIARRPKSPPDPATLAIDSLKTRVAAGYLALNEKIDASQKQLTEKLDASHKELLSAIADQGASFERRIDLLEVNLARLNSLTR